MNERMNEAQRKAVTRNSVVSNVMMTMLKMMMEMMTFRVMLNICVTFVAVGVTTVVAVIFIFLAAAINYTCQRLYGMHVYL